MIFKIFRRIKKMFVYIYNRMLLSTQKVDYNHTLRVNGPLVIVGNKNNIHIGKDVIINSNMYEANPVGANNKTILKGNITIGNNSGISNTTIVAIDEVKIGNNVLIGGGCEIYDNDFHSLNYEDRMKVPDTKIISKKIEICDGAFIGAHTIILKGVVIGKKSIVGAGSVVTKSIPSGEIWAGNPAKFIKKIDN